MSLASENEIAIRRALANKIAFVPEAGAVIPAPVFFADRSDFWAQINALSVNTQKLIETTNLAFCCISLLKRVDSVSEGCADNPFVRLTYNFYLLSNKFETLPTTPSSRSRVKNIAYKLAIVTFSSNCLGQLTRKNCFGITQHCFNINILPEDSI